VLNFVLSNWLYDSPIKEELMTQTQLEQIYPQFGLTFLSGNRA